MRKHTGLKSMHLLVCFFLIIVSPDHSCLADGNPLFLEAEDSRSLSALEAKHYVLRTRAVRVNQSLFSERRSSSEFRGMLLNLFPDFEIRAHETRFKNRGPGSFVWIGKPLDEPLGLVVLTSVKGHLAGVVFTSGRRFGIRSLEPGKCLVIELNQSFRPRCGHDFVPPPDSSPSPPQTNLRLTKRYSDSGYVTDIMVLVTKRAAQSVEDIASEVQLAIDTTNEVYEASGVITRLRLVHLEEVDYEAAPKSDLRVEIDQLWRQDDGVLDHIHTLRDEHGADVVTMIVGETGSNVGGVGGTMSDKWWNFDPLFFEKYAFSVCVMPFAKYYFILAHEVGHNQGLAHDRYQWLKHYGADTDIWPFFSYGWGYSIVEHCSLTIMAYGDECKDSGCKFVDRIPYFSNPNLTYEGSPLGVEEGLPDEAFAAKAINMAAIYVANFRPSVYPVEEE